MSLSAADFPEGMSEIEALGLKTVPSSVVQPPRLATARASLEGREIEFVKIGNNPVIFGEIVAVHLDPVFLDEKLHVKTEQMQIVGRMQGGPNGGYSRTDHLFHVPRPSYEEWLKSQSNT
jgi:flavin reductase (DIM6/NTAB) family NADH-FMN oxidoreductase RutF